MTDIEHRFPSLKAKTEALPEDEWDGMCDSDFEMGPDTTDELLPWVVLFASHVDHDYRVRDRGALEAKAAQWRALFGGE